MAHLGKRRAQDADLDEPSGTGLKRHHAASTVLVVTPAAVAQHQPIQQWPQQAEQQQVQMQQQQQQGPLFGQQFAAPIQVDAAAASPSAAAQLQSAVGTGVLSPAAAPLAAGPLSPAAAPAQCKDLVVYQPQHKALFETLGGLSSTTAPLQQQQQATPQPQQQQHQQQQQPMPFGQQSDLDTARNDNAALKSVWRTLTPAQRRSLAGMWDMIKTEQLLPRLMPNSGLLALPSTDLDQQQQQQRWRPQQHSCIIEEEDGDTDHKQQQQQQQQQPVLANGFITHNGLNGFAAAAAAAAAAGEAPAGDVDMQVDQQQQQCSPILAAPARAASVEDMEM